MSEIFLKAMPFVDITPTDTPATHSPVSNALAPTTAGDDLAPLVWRGLILTIVTLGFYRFWYKTDLRRWYWRNTLVGEHALEYRGTARELFIGFLFALAVVLPLYFSGSLIALFAGDALGSVVSGLSGLIFAILVQYGAYRSRRYRLTRTFWRGVRFDQAGSAWRYAAVSVLWLAATVVTLGLLFPYLRRALERYRITHTRFGSAEGSFEVAMGPLMKRWLVLWGVSLAGLGSAALLLAMLNLPFETMGSGPVAYVALGGIPLVLLILPFLLWPLYRGAEFRAFTNGTAIGGVGFKSAFPTRGYYGIFFRFALVFLTAIIAWGVVLALAGYGMHTSGLLSFTVGGLPAAFLALLMVGYLGTFLLFGGIKETVLNQRFWRLAVQTLTIVNLAAADNIMAQSVAEEAATGEGLADAFDFGGV